MIIAIISLCFKMAKFCLKILKYIVKLKEKNWENSNNWRKERVMRQPLSSDEAAAKEEVSCARTALPTEPRALTWGEAHERKPSQDRCGVSSVPQAGLADGTALSAVGADCTCGDTR